MTLGALDEQLDRGARVGGRIMILQWLEGLVIGSVAFWVPDCAYHLFFGGHSPFDPILMLLMLATTLISFGFSVKTITPLPTPLKLSAAFVVGIWILGPAFMMLGATLEGGGFAAQNASVGSPWSFLLFATVFPVATFFMAKAHGTLFQLLTITVLLPMLGAAIKRKSTDRDANAQRRTRRV